jgi:hypothetical protein
MSRHGSFFRRGRTWILESWVPRLGGLETMLWMRGEVGGGAWEEVSYVRLILFAQILSIYPYILHKIYKVDRRYGGDSELTIFGNFSDT